MVLVEGGMTMGCWEVTALEIGHRKKDLFRGVVVGVSPSAYARQKKKFSEP